MSVFALLALFTVGCELVAAQKQERAGPEWQRHEGVRPAFRGGEFERENVELPAGLAVTVQLEQEISSRFDRPGDTFRVRLLEPLEQNGYLIAPAGSEAIGDIVYVRRSGRVKGRAEMSFVLRHLIVGDRTYDFRTNTIRVRAEGNRRRDTERVAGGAVLGAIIGGIVHGGGTGAGYDLLTRGDSVEFGPGARFVFRLTNPVVLPAYERAHERFHEREGR